MCNDCQPFGGRFRPASKGGMERCTCGDNPALAQIDADRKAGTAYPPRLTTDEVQLGMEMLSGVCNYVPAAGSPGRTAAAEELRSMCRNAADMLWLVKRMGQLFSEWPGARSMRAVYCSKARPLDGVETEAICEQYPEGIPSEKLEAVSAPSYPQLRSGDAASNAESVRVTVEALVEAKDMKNFAKPKRPVPDIPIFPGGAHVTQADIEAAVNANRERIAREELGL